MAYYLDKHDTDGFVSPATQARFEKSLATAQTITGTILSVNREISTFVDQMFGPIQRHAKARRTAKALHGLTDQQLSDIGVARGEIDAVAHEAVEARVIRRHV
jgi:uncharacterized protein YjiS (DUF1127 family)